MSFDPEPAREAYFEEAAQLLEALESGLLGLGAEASDPEGLNAVFRAAHTIKGSAGLFGLSSIVTVAHAIENVLDALRSGQRAVTPLLVTGLLEATDLLRTVVSATREGREVPIDEARLAGLGEARPAPQPPAAQDPSAVRSFAVQVDFGPDVLRHGMDPLAMVRYLHTLGEVSEVEANLDTLPAGPGYDPERCYLGLRLALATRATLDQVTAVFDFVQDSSRVEVRQLDPRPSPAEEVVAAPPAAPAKGPAPDARMVRVRGKRVDQLVDLVGELVIAGSTSTALAHHSSPALRESLDTLNTLLATLRDCAMGLRTAPIGEVFGRFRRVVRDVSAQLGKEIQLELYGEHTELDRVMVERLVDPLVHLVRNAVDHGIESPAVRRAAGKPGRGRVVLEAARERGSVVITVRDDGAGLDRARILAKARARGLIDARARLSDDEVDQLIFLPGFSSAETVSELSGRGVGMDVVRKAVDALRGTVEVDSRPGEGLTVRLRLPLTLAIVDGFLVEVSGRIFVVPVELVQECMALAGVVESEVNRRLDVRGEPLAFIRLRELFSLPVTHPTRESVVVVEYARQRVALVVDRLLGASQTVVKPLGPVLADVRGIDGSTVLGSGAVGLVLDVPRLVELASLAARGTDGRAAWTAQR